MENKGLPHVCIVIVNWNNWRDTVLCLQSVMAVDYDAYQLIVVDNGSTNDSVARIKSNFPESVIIGTGRNLGFGAGANVGIRCAMESHAKYIWLLNNDTMIDRGALNALVSVAEDNPGTGAVGAVIYSMDNRDRVEVWGGGRVNLYLGTSRCIRTPQSSAKLDYLVGASLLLRVAALCDVGLFDEKFFMYWEDTDLSFRLRAYGWQLSVADSCKVWHNESSSLGKGSARLDEMISESMVRFLVKHSPHPRLAVLAGGCGRVAKRIFSGRIDRAFGVLRGMRKGVRST